jgi:hypothetical protein
LIGRAGRLLDHAAAELGRPEQQAGEQAGEQRGDHADGEQTSDCHPQMLPSGRRPPLDKFGGSWPATPTWVPDLAGQRAAPHAGDDRRKPVLASTNAGDSWRSSRGLDPRRGRRRLAPSARIARPKSEPAITTLGTLHTAAPLRGTATGLLAHDRRPTAATGPRASSTAVYRASSEIARQP